MPFDPFGIQRYHEDVRERIGRGEPGLAQSFVGRELVSFEVDEKGWGHLQGNVPAGVDAVEEMILDVARHEGIASSAVFAAARVAWMIRDREAWPSDVPKKHQEAALLRQLVQRRPELFID